MAYSTVALTPHSNHVRREALTAVGSAIKPGMLVELVAGEYQEHSTTAVKAAKFIALEKISTAGDIETAYGAGETCFVGSFPSGESVAMLVTTAQVLTVGALLTSTGDGTLTLVGATAANAVAISKEALTTSGTTRVEVELID